MQDEQHRPHQTTEVNHMKDEQHRPQQTTEVNHSGVGAAHLSYG
jgi:hypothetical protein